MSEDEVKIAASSLGTKEFWDQRYETELENFEDCGDEGEIWFGRSAENRIVTYLINSKKDKTVPILDLGCGNGSVLRRLRSKGFSNLVGVDYCPSAIELSRRLSDTEKEENDITIDIQFEVMDVLSPECIEQVKGKYSVILDKGTWDAMSLSDERESRRQAYKAAVLAGLVPDGRLVLFSCNFTREELCGMFEGDGLKFDSVIPAVSSFSFGGKQGVTSTGIVFVKH